jgi:hypothetical protein
MNMSKIFKAAHAMTKATIKAGDNYAVTFGAALKICIADAKAPAMTTLEAIKAKFSVNAWNDRFYINLPSDRGFRGDNTTKIYIKDDKLEISPSKGTLSRAFSAAFDDLLATIEANGGVKVRGYSSPFDRTYTITL